MADPAAETPIPPPRAVLFDWDNTLVNAWPAIHRALNAAQRAFGQTEWTYDQTLARTRRSLRESFPEMFGADWERARTIFYDTYHACHLEVLAPLAGARAVLDRLVADRVPAGVVSNKAGDLIRAEVAHLGWADRFAAALVGATDAPRDKPARDPVDLALADTGIAAGPEVWFVGDTGIDIACAHAAGCTAVLIHDGPAEDPAFAAAAPHLHLPDLIALAGALDHCRVA